MTQRQTDVSAEIFYVGSVSEAYSQQQNMKIPQSEALQSNVSFGNTDNDPEEDPNVSGKFYTIQFKYSEQHTTTDLHYTNRDEARQIWNANEEE